MKQQTIFLFILFLTASKLFTQGLYLKENVDATAIGYTYSYVNDIVVNTISVGHTFERTFDIGIGFGFNDDVRAYSFGFNYNTCKDCFLMFSPGVRVVHYEFLSLTNDDNITLNGFAIGAAISKRFNIVEHFGFVPSLNFSAMFLENRPYLEKNTLSTLNFNFCFIGNTNNNTYFGIEPSIIYDFENAGMSITGFVIF